MIDEINSIDKQIAELAAKKQALLNSKRHEALQQAKTLISQHSLTAIELGLRGKGKSASARVKAAAKYANPSNSNETWAGGKGARPKWVKQHLANGGSIDQLLIDKA